MYIYVANFKNHPNLIKIGKADCPSNRLESLSRTHGDLVFHDTFFIGEDCFKVEKSMHRKYKSHNAKETVEGDGYTEFFQDSIYDDVCCDLDKYTDGSVFRKAQVEKSILKEDIRCAKLVSRLLGCGYNSLYDGSRTQLFSGYWELASLNTCIDMGFPKEEVFAKYVASGKSRLRTTTGRVAIAHSLFTGLVFTSNKMRHLKSLLDD